MFSSSDHEKENNKRNLVAFPFSPQGETDEPIVENVLFWIHGPFRTQLFVICAAIFSNMFLYGIVIGLAPMYRKDLQLTNFSLGALFTGFTIISALLIPLLGLTVVQLPNKVCFVFGGIACAISALLMAIDDETFVMICTARVIHGWGSCVIWICGPDTVSNFFRIPSQTKAMGVVYIFSTAATLAGIVLGANSFDWTGTTFPIYAATFLMNVCCTVLVITSVPADGPDVDFDHIVSLYNPDTLKQGLEEYKALLQQRNVVLLLFSVFLFAVGSVFVQAFIPSWVVNNLHTSVSGAADLYAIMAVSKLASQPFFGRLTEKIGANLVLGLGTIVFGLVLPVLPVVESVWATVLAFTALGLGMTATVLPSFISLSNYVDKVDAGPVSHGRRRYTLANSLWLFAFMVGSTMTPVVAGAFLDTLTGLSEMEVQWAHSAVLGCLAVVMALIQGPIYIYFTRDEDAATLENYQPLTTSD